MLNFLQTVDNNFIVSVFRQLSAWLDSVVYSLVQLLFNLFFAVAETTINDTIVYEIFNRVGLIVGVVMLFVIGFNLINYIITPDALNDKKKGAGGLIFRVVLTIVLLASVNNLFDYARRLEIEVVKSNFIGKLITGNASSFDVENEGSIGNYYAKEVFFIFFTDSSSASGNWNAEEIKMSISAADSFWILPNYVNLQDSSGNYIFEYKTIWSTVTGCFMVFMLGAYILSVGMRTIQLAYLQLISPIPILLNILPNGDSKLKTWSKQVFTTYLDLFIRLIIINLAFFFLYQIFKTEKLFNYSSNAGDLLGFVKIIIMIGLLMFAKKAPELIKELFPSSGAAAGDFGLSWKKRLKDLPGAKIAAGAVGIAALGGKKLVAGIDAKKNGYSFKSGSDKVQGKGPLSKLKKGWRDITPYSVETKNKKITAETDMKTRDKMIEKGQKIYKDNNGSLSSNSFTNGEYQKSWQSMKDAKNAVKESDNKLEAARAELNAAYNSGDKDKISAATANYQDASKSAKSAQGVLDFRKTRHDDVKKKYADDAKIEESFDYYEKSTSMEERENVLKNSNSNNSSNSSSSPRGNDIQGSRGNGVSQSDNVNQDTRQYSNGDDVGE